MNPLVGRRSKNMFFVCFVPTQFVTSLNWPFLIPTLERVFWWQPGIDSFDATALLALLTSYTWTGSNSFTPSWKQPLWPLQWGLGRLSCRQPGIDPLHGGGGSKGILKLTRLHFWPTFARTAWNLPFWSFYLDSNFMKGFIPNVCKGRGWGLSTQFGIPATWGGGYSERSYNWHVWPIRWGGWPKKHIYQPLMQVSKR